MRLHCNWMVLVTIVWTILLTISAQESIANASTVRGFEGGNGSAEKHALSSNKHSLGNGNTTDGRRNEIPDDAATSFQQMAEPSSSPESGKVEDIETEEENVQENSQERELNHENISTSISVKNSDKNHEQLQRSYLRSDENISANGTEESLDGAIHRVNSLNQPTSNSSKGHAVDAKFGGDTAGSNASAHQELFIGNRAPILAGVSEYSAPLIANSNASPLNHRTSDQRPRTRSDEYARSSTNSSSRSSLVSAQNRLIRKAARSSRSNGNIKHAGFSLPDAKGSSAPLADIALVNDDIAHKSENKWSTLNVRSDSVEEKFKTWEARDAGEVAKTVQGIRAVDRSARRERIVADEAAPTSEEKSDSNKSNKIEPSIKNQVREDFPADEQTRVIDPTPNYRNLGPSVLPEFPTQREAHQAATSASSAQESAGFIARGRTNNINLPAAANDIPRALFEERSVQNSVPSDTGSLNTDASISTESTENFQHTSLPSEELRSKSPLSLHPAIKMVEAQRQRVQDINYQESKKANGRSYLTSLSGNESSKIKGERVAVAGRKQVLENTASRRRGSDDERSNEPGETPDVSVAAKMLHNDGEFVDNVVNPDGAGDSGIHRSVVKLALAGFQTEQRSHKSLIAQDFSGGINPREDQTPEEVQERKKQVRNVFSEMDTPKIEGSLVWGDEAGRSITLENSNAFSHESEPVQRITDASDDPRIEPPRRARKMEFSKSNLANGRTSGEKKTDDDVDQVISSRGLAKVTGALRRVAAMDERDFAVVETNLAKPEEKIDWHIAADTTSSMGSELPELHPRDRGPDDSGKAEYDCNGDRVTTQVIRLRDSRQQHEKAFIQRRHGEDSSGKILAGGQLENLTKLDETFAPSASVTSIGMDDSVASRTSAKGPKNILENKTVDDELTASSRFVSILLEDPAHINDTASVQSPLELDDENNPDDKHVPMKYGLLDQKMYNGKKKIQETNSVVGTINTLKVDDSTGVENDSLEIRKETSNRSNDKTVDVQRCKTCQIARIAEQKSVENEAKGAASRVQRDHKRVYDDAKKTETGVMDFQELGSSTVRAGNAGTNEIPVDPIFTAANAASLTHASAAFTVINHLRPEARVRERLQQREETGTLVTSQEPIFIAPKRVNLILPREQAASERPFGSGEFTANDDASSSGSIIELPIENNENSSDAVHFDDERDFHASARKKAYAEEARGPSIPRVIDSLTARRSSSPPEFSNNALSVPRSQENFNMHATAQTGSSSVGGGRRRKSLGHDALTGGSTSSTKTDSGIWSIVPTSNDDRYPMRKELHRVAQSEASSVSPVLYDDSGKDDSVTEQIKRGFTRENTITVSVTKPTTRRYSEYGASARVLIPELQPSINPTENIMQAIERKTAVYESSGMDSLPVIETGNQSSNDETFPAGASNVNVALPNSRNGSPGENIASYLEAGDSRSLNHTDRDNSTRITATLNQWPVKHSAVVEGDLLLGGLMMVHEREDSITCGPVMPQGGVQALEAMLYTLDWLNKRDLVPGVKIGAHILDDCDKDTYGLEMAVDFIKGSISNIDGAEYHCNKTAVRKVISGVVGAASSVTSIQVANLLRLFRIPQVSFFSTSPELSNKMRFEYFTRTIPSDHYQVKAMVDIVLVMGWSYVSIIYEESNYGEKAYEELEKLLGKHQICIAVKEKLSKDSGVAEAHVYDNIVLKLLTKPRARGCIIFASDQEVAGVMKAVRRCNATGAFSWIGSDGWSARSLVSDGNEPEMEGTLSVQPQANPVEGFEDYFLNLTVENNRRNPWFVEFWEDHFKCRYPNASQTPYNNYTEECTTTERLTKQNTAFEDQLQFVSDAVLAFAYAFREMHKDLCRGNPGLCDAMKPTKGTELLNYLRNVEFKGLSGDTFHFDKNGDGPARYNIIHFKQVSPGKYKWIKVGKYLEGELRLNMSEIQFRLGHPEPPESVCSLPCEVGQAKKYVEGESCCWHCFNCTQYQIRHLTDEKQCVLCPQGTVPDETHSYCRDIPEEFLRPESGWAIGAMSFSSTGILITLFVGGVFLKHNDTPIVRASGRELSYVLLTGILLCYLVTFALVLRPNDYVCSIQRLSAGFCFTVVYAALLTKTNRIARIFNAGKHSAKRPSFISPRSQLIICSMLVGVQILINVVWMVIDPAKAMHHYPTREDNLLVCNSYINASYMIAFTYPIILIVVCTVYAVLTRKIPEAFNESKHIGFTMYTTCVIWLAFVPLYFATGSHVALRITSMSVTISLSASVTIACLFSPKLYIILIHPERNVRPNMMMQNRYNTTKGSVTATNASSMLAPVTLTAVTCDQNKAVKKHVITTIDSSTQIEQYEMELKDQKNGKITPAFVTRETQTLLNNNGKEPNAVASPVIKDIITEDNVISSKGLGMGKIANGPMNQNEVSL